ncbi:MAG: DUF1415 domain-containing protein [Flavitalea sp.]
MERRELIIYQTRKWITDVVAGCNFCPFAAKELKLNTIHFQVEMDTHAETALKSFLQECIRLDEDKNIETILLIFPESFGDFDTYLNLAELAELLLEQEGYEGIYQVASFHPLYCFAGESPEDPANYTNRSPYPMLHLLREESVERALLHFPNPENIPDRNIQFAREKGEAYMKLLRNTCFS